MNPDLGVGPLFPDFLGRRRFSGDVHAMDEILGNALPLLEPVKP